jgi:hypothetical protein
MRKNNSLSLNMMENLEEKILKMTNFKVNYRLVEEDNSAQIILLTKPRLLP